MSGQIVQIVPAAPGWNAVFRSSEGEPAPGSEVARGVALVPVACWALVEDDEGRRGVLPLTGGDDTAGLVIADRALAISPPGHRPQDWSAAVARPRAGKTPTGPRRRPPPERRPAAKPRAEAKPQPERRQRPQVDEPVLLDSAPEQAASEPAAPPPRDDDIPGGDVLDLEF